eukprot:TRINITY_DN30018_c0_g1_i1.p1 TRINITY_DN30018_c0_g1~~TRINITY_DN30018_c0_g1_i1.p1  ORF type:complete len:556 (+),score=69.47 TRINITY_DN30018_c0_g1_i1:196-1668(+)
MSILSMPLVISTFGVLVAVFQGPLLWCCHPRQKTYCSRKVSGILLLGVSCTTFFVIVGSSAWISLTSAESYNLTVEDLTRVDREANYADKVCRDLEQTGVRALAGVGELVNTCPSHVQPMLQQVLKKPSKLGNGYMKTVRYTGSIVRLMPGLVDELRRVIVITGQTAVVVLAAPPLLALLTMLVVGVAAFLAPRRESGKSVCLHRSADFCIALVPLLIVIIIAAAALQLTIGSTIASVCPATPELGVSYTKHMFGFDSPAFTLTRYYLQGKGDNTCLQVIGKADVLLEGLVRDMKQYSVGMSQACPEWTAVNKKLLSDLARVRQSLEVGKQLLSPYSIYDYYIQTWRSNLCGAILDVLGLAALSNIMLGFLCLPMLAVAASSYLSHYRHPDSEDVRCKVSPKRADQQYLEECVKLPNLLQSRRSLTSVVPHKSKLFDEAEVHDLRQLYDCSVTPPKALSLSGPSTPTTVTDSLSVRTAFTAGTVRFIDKE